MKRTNKKFNFISKAKAERFGTGKIKRIWDRTTGRCGYCGRGLVPPKADANHHIDPKIDENSFTVDHIKPTSKGGNNSLWNLIASCKKCNNIKGSASEEYLRFKLITDKHSQYPKFNHRQFEWLWSRGILLSRFGQYEFLYEKLGKGK